MDKLNVCLINDSFPPAIDGVANAVVNYGSIINRELGQATVVTPFYPDADDSAFPFPVVRYPSLDMTKFVGYRAGMPFSPELMETLTQGKFDIIHSHCPITSTMVARSLRETIRVPVVFTYHTKFDIDIANAISSRRLQSEAARLLVENIAACDEVWTVSNGAGENLRKLGFAGEYRVMPNGVDFPRGRVDEAQIAAVTAGYDFPAGVPVFLFVGRMMWYKGIRIILDALKLLDEAGEDFRMVFIGGGGDRQEIIACSEELGLQKKVFFSEPIRDREKIRAWYCRADLFLFPSTFDTNGLVVREAAACALGSVLVAGSCAAEDIADGRSGFLIEENAASMAAKLRELIAHPAAMAEVGRHAQEDIYISWEEAVRRAYERYGVVIDNFRAGRYPAHESLSDEFFRGMASTLEQIGRRRALNRRTLEAGRAAYAQFVNEMNEGYERLVSDMNEEHERLISGLNEEHERLKSEVNRTLEDFYSLLDRFL